MKKKIVDSIFILVTGVILMLLIRYDLYEKYLGFSLIPIMIAYFFGQYTERKFNAKNSQKKDLN